jgi:hypothetical protein
MRFLQDTAVYCLEFRRVLYPHRGQRVCWRVGVGAGGGIYGVDLDWEWWVGVRVNTNWFRRYTAAFGS